MTDASKRKRTESAPRKAALGGETVEPRILLSATWVDGTPADDAIAAHNTGGDGVEALIGGAFDDVFSFANPVAGAVYTVTGDAGSDAIDLSGFASSAVTFGDSTLTVDLGGGQSFRIDYAAVESIGFADADAVVVTSDLDVSSFAGAGIFIDGDQAFRIDVGGAGSLDWSYAVATDTLTITATNATNSTTSVAITDLNGTDLSVGTITVDETLGSLSCDVDIGTISITAGNATIQNVTVRGGVGTIGAFETTGGHLRDTTTINADVTAIRLSQDLKGNLTVNGAVGSIDLRDLDAGWALHVTGDLGALTMEDADGTVQVDGDLDSATIASVDSGGTVTAVSVLGNLDFQVGGAQHGGTFVTPTHFWFDGATQTGTATPIDAPPVANWAPVLRVQAVPTALAGEIVVVSATATDADGDPLLYTWTQLTGPPVVISGGDQASASFTVPDVTAPTELVFQVEVSDGRVSVTQVVVVSVSPQAGDTPAAPTPGGTFTPEPEGPTEAPGQPSRPAASPTPRSERASPPPPPPPAPTTPDVDVEPTTESPDSTGPTPRTGPESERDSSERQADTSMFSGFDDADDERVVAGPTDTPPDLVIGDAGREIDLAPHVAAPAGIAVNYVWTQIGGTPIALGDPADNGAMRIRLPEVFAEEELVFEVTMVTGGQQTVQEITVQVQPVSPTARTMVLDDTDQDAGAEVLGAAVDDTGRGLGRIWAALLAFFGAQPDRGQR